MGGSLLACTPWWCFCGRTLGGQVAGVRRRQLWVQDSRSRIDMALSGMVEASIGGLPGSAGILASLLRSRQFLSCDGERNFQLCSCNQKFGMTPCPGATVDGQSGEGRRLAESALHTGCVVRRFCQCKVPRIVGEPCEYAEGGYSYDGEKVSTWDTGGVCVKVTVRGGGSGL